MCVCVLCYLCFFSLSDEGSVVTESEGEEDPAPSVNDPSNPWLRQEGGRTNRSKHMQSPNQGKGVANFNEDDSEDELTAVLKEQSESVIGKVSSAIIDPHDFMKSSGDMKKTRLASASDNLLAVQEAFAGTHNIHIVYFILCTCNIHIVYFILCTCNIHIVYFILCTCNIHIVYFILCTCNMHIVYFILSLIHDCTSQLMQTV